MSRGPTSIKPETAHPAFDKACHLFGIELRRAPVDPVTTQVDVDWVRDHVDDQTVALIGSACNYGYGTVDPIGDLSDVALERGVGLHVDSCLGGFILPFGRELGYDIPAFDYALPGVTSMSADTHKYGYAFKGSSVVSFRSKALRNAQYFYLTDWSGGKYTSPGMEGSRSGGLIAATWASMVQLGHAGYLGYARQIFETSFAMQEAVTSHPELRLVGRPTFLFSFTSDEFDVYHVNDFMRTRGWRFNGQQYPNALHMAVTRPQTQPQVVARVRRRLGRRRGLRQGARRRGPQVRRHLRRGRRRHDRGGRRVHPRRHGRHARRAVLHPSQVTSPEGGAPTGWVAGCAAAQASLDATLVGLDDDTARRPSRLADWTVGHVLTHIARNADSVVWRLEGAARGELRDQYPGGLEQRRADIEAGAGRPAGRVVRRRPSDLGGRGAGHRRAPRRGLGRPVTHLARVWWRARATRCCPAGARWWSTTAISASAPSRSRPSWSSAWLPGELPRLAERTDPARLLSWIIGRADPPALAAWQTMRPLAEGCPASPR